MLTNQYEIVKSKDNINVIRVVRENKKICIGSLYNAKRDIDTFLNTLGNVEEEDIIFVYGIGAGEHVLALLNRIHENNRVIVIEPDENISFALEDNEIIKSILKDERVKVYIYNSNIGNLSYIFKSEVAEHQLSGIKFSFFANYNLIFNEEFIDFTKKFKDIITNAHMDRNTNIAFSKVWFDSFIRNIKIMAKGTPVDNFKDRFKGKPAIIVSAGPSLKKNIHYLREAKDKFVIITGGRTLKALLEVDVVPDFVCVVDPIDKTFKLLEQSLSCSAPLVFYEGTNPDVVSNYKGEKIFYTSYSFSGDFIDTTEDSLSLGGSVAHTCFGLSMLLGCQTVVFIGQDFAFTGERIHADNATILNEKNIINVGDNLLLVDDVYGNKVKTDIPFNIFRKTMENLIKCYPDRQFINATEGGAHIQGTMVIALIDAIKNYGEQNINKDITDCIINKNEEKFNEIVESMNKIKQLLADIKSDCQQGVKFSQQLFDHFDKGKKVSFNRINKQLETIDMRLKDVFDKANFANFILYPVTQVILSANEYKVLKTDSDREKGKKISLKSLKLYQGINTILDEAICIIEKSLTE